MKKQKFGRTLFVKGGYTFQVTAQYEQWLDFLQSEIETSQETKAKLAKARDEVVRLKAALEAVRGWNALDIEGFEDITPDMAMLEARAERIDIALGKEGA